MQRPAPTAGARPRGVQAYGPWAVVTGASDGIGRAFAEQLAAAGLSLVLVARRERELGELAEHLRRAHGSESIVVPADLGRAAERARVTAATDGLDVGLLVAAAGFGTSGAFLDADLRAELDMLAVNCGAIVAQTHEFARRFAARGHGGIVLMSSIVAFQGVPRAAHYAATKAYVQTFAEGLARELAGGGVRVVACAPGPVRSGFAARAEMQLGATVAPDVVARRALAALGRRTTVTPGALSKVLTAALRPLPRAGRVRVMQRVMAGMTQARAAAHGPPPRAGKAEA